MLETNNEIISPQIIDIANQFDKLDNEKKLEFVKLILEKMENGEIEINGKTIHPGKIGIEDGFACCRAIVKLLK